MKKIKASIIKDESTGFYTSFLNRDRPGGPIISSDSLEKVKEDFIEAYNLCYAVTCLLRYATHKDFNVFDTENIDLPMPQEVEFEEVRTIFY